MAGCFIAGRDDASRGGLQPCAQVMDPLSGLLPHFTAMLTEAGPLVLLILGLPACPGLLPFPGGHEPLPPWHGDSLGPISAVSCLPADVVGA